MPYLLIEDFKLGVDLRKSAAAAEPGSLRTLRNAFVNPGGEIEKRRTLTLFGELPPGTHGLAFDPMTANTLMVFGTTAAPSPLPGYVSYQRLVLSGGSPSLVRVRSAHHFAGKLYVVADFSDGTTRHFHDGVQIPQAQISAPAAMPFGRKMYAVGSGNLYFSALADPTDWTTGTGAGVIDVTQEDTAPSHLVGLARYYGWLAVLARTFVQVWAVDPDPALSQLVQTVPGVGLVGPRASAGFANGDLLFLSDSGVRSLRARDASSAAVLFDVGAPVDEYIRSRRAQMLGPGEADMIQAVVDPLSGHWWLIWGDEALVLAYSPDGRIKAWSLFDFGAPVSAHAVANSRLVLRRGDEILVYGSLPPIGNPFDPNAPTGAPGALYGPDEVIVETPFLDAKSPAQVKRWTGLDMTCEGTWQIEVNPDVTQPSAWTTVGTVSRSTWGEGRIPLDIMGTHMAVRLVSNHAGPARLSTLALHFEGGEQS